MKKILRIFAAVLFILLTFSNFLYQWILTRSGRERIRKAVDRLNSKRDAGMRHPIKDTKEFRDFLKPYEDWCHNADKDIWYLQSFDGLLLKARHYNCPGSNRWMIGVHGYGSTHEELFPGAKVFHEHGYHVLLVSCRAHDDSEGNDITMGWYDRLDMMKWIEKLLLRAPKAEIALYGISMGAATVMMISGEVLPSNVKCIIEDCGFTSVMEEFTYQIPRYLKIPAFPWNVLISLVCRLRMGYSFQEASALSQVKKSKTPILFIHGSKDKFIPVSMVYRLYDAADCPKELYIVEGASHAVSYYVDAENYWKKIFAFIDQF